MDNTFTCVRERGSFQDPGTQFSLGSNHGNFSIIHYEIGVLTIHDMKMNFVVIQHWNLHCEFRSCNFYTFLPVHLTNTVELKLSEQWYALSEPSIVRTLARNVTICYIVSDIGRAWTRLSMDRLPRRCSASTSDERAVFASPVQRAVICVNNKLLLVSHKAMC